MNVEKTMGVAADTLKKTASKTHNGIVPTMKSTKSISPQKILDAMNAQASAIASKIKGQTPPAKGKKPIVLPVETDKAVQKVLDTNVEEKPVIVEKVMKKWNDNTYGGPGGISFYKDTYGEKTPVDVIKKLTQDGINSGHGTLSAKEAANGAKATVAATGIRNNFKSAEESAKAMDEAGLFKELDKQARKSDLQERYGKKVKQKRAKDAADAALARSAEYRASELAKVDDILAEYIKQH